ncbi:TMEM175 family protein [Novosphingobium sp. 9]|uniref:TMEM175 family protein n=1 Tax=Novosphingobium sp. 9 TaxID=2025349 RepID=UPI0021B545DB|nr:TMEM175 family protein [Novosphingobium sp. 9]
MGPQAGAFDASPAASLPVDVLTSQNPTPHSGGAGFALERVVFFSDAVFAIAITLLVLEIEVPHLPEGAGASAYWHDLAGLVPSLLAFLLSFLVIGRFWIGHHQIFSRVSHFAQGLLWPNLACLFTIATMPFTTAFVAAGHNSFVPALCYNLNLLAAGIATWFLMLRVKQLGLAVLEASGDQGGAGSPAVIVAAVLSVALAFVVPTISQAGMLTLPLWRLAFRRLTANGEASA